MKRLTCLLLFLLLLLPVCARADVIWEPTGNTFYDTHLDECLADDHLYTALTESKGYRAPGDFFSGGKVDSGDTVSFGFLYTDASGETWGLSESSELWYNVSDFSAHYNATDFSRDRAEEITAYEGALKDYTIKDAIVLWTYPNSGEITGYIYASEQEEGLYSDSAFTQQYVDEGGRLWVYSVYYYGLHDVWAYADDPENESIEILSTTPTVSEDDIMLISEDSAEPVSEASPDQTLWWVVGLVLFAVTLSALLIALFVGSRRAREKKED